MQPEQTSAVLQEVLAGQPLLAPKVHSHGLTGVHSAVGPADLTQIVRIGERSCRDVVCCICNK
jgi:hypothetical protein